MKKYFILTILFSTSLQFSFTMQSKKTIVFFGDSLTAGYGLSTAQAFPAVVQQVLNDNGFDYEVVNAGLSGETSAGGLSRIDWILQKEIDIFILELGANDALRGLPLDQTKTNLQAIIDKVKAKYPNANIVIAGMMAPPNLGEEYTSEFRNIFTTISQDNKASFIPFLLDGVAGNKSLNLPDGIHPNVEGHKIVANNVIQVLNYIL
jgi:acyl-CoA thioesterase-1